eukprot:6200483-Pleurochrysis_carterae.AAC.2
MMSNCPDEWGALFHRKVDDETVHGGCIVLDENALKPTSNLYAHFRRRCAKYYQTAADIADAEVNTEV